MNAVKKSIAIFLVIITILSTFSVATPVFAAGNLFGKTTDDFYVQEEMTSKIVSEVTELRNEYEKHFVCEDGSFVVAMYNDPVHYKENGQWKEIDNSLKLTADAKSSSGKSMYSPKAGIVDVKIPQNFSDGQKVSATNKGYTISFGANHDKIIYQNKPTAVVKEVEDLSSSKITDKAMVTQKSVAASATLSNESDITTFNNDAMAVDNQSGAVVYENVFGNDDLEYIVTTNSIKENIVVNEKQDNYIYSFDMDFGELTPIVNEDNSIRVVNPADTEETIFYIEAPYMYDANEVESTAIEMSLVEEDGIYVMTLQAEAEWMNASERVFPVVIDPTVYLSFDDVFVMDGLLNKNTTKVNNELRVGRNLTNLTRTYIKPTLPTNIPAGSYISSAYLKLIKDAYYQAPSASTISVRVYDCYDVNSWNPTNITWENQPYSNSDNGYSSGHSYLSSVSATSSKTTYSFGITAAVRRWVEGGVNNGIMLASSNESTKTQIDFHSSRASDSSNYPKMYITYTAPSLSVSTWETNSQASEKSFTIKTGKDWTAYTDADWISLSATSGTPSSGSSTNKIIVTENTSAKKRTGTIIVKVGNSTIGTITVAQCGEDHIAPSKPYLYEEDGLVYILSTSFNFNEEYDSPETLQYKLDDGAWTDYTEPLEIVNTTDVTIYARTIDEAGNTSLINSITASSTLGQYNFINTDIVLGEGILPVDFTRRYSSNTGWFFSFDANIAPYGTDGYIFTDFNGYENYYLKNGKNKYVNISGEELIFNSNNNTYSLDYGNYAICFNENGKLTSIEKNNVLTNYVWNNDSLVIGGIATVTFNTDLQPTSITITKEKDGIAYSKSVSYSYTNGNLTRFTDAVGIIYNYSYTDGKLTSNNGEIISYIGNRVQKITQPNNAFVKYEYEDNAQNPDYNENINFGRVKISDSKGVTDYVYYSDGFYVSNNLSSYSENAIYNPNSISNDIITNDIASIAYIISAQTWYEESDTENESTFDDLNIDEYPLYETDSDGNYIFYKYDEYHRIIKQLQVDATSITVNNNTTFEQAEVVAKSKNEYDYDDYNNVVGDRTYERILNALRLTYSEISTYSNNKINHLEKTSIRYTQSETEILSETVLKTVDYEYDIWNQCIKITENTNTDKAKTTTYSYDKIGRTLQTSENGQTVEYTYHDDKLSCISVNGEITEYHYLNDGNLYYVTKPNDENIIYSYDDYGNLWFQTYNRSYSLQYNTLGSVVAMYSRFDEALIDRLQRVQYTYSQDVKQNVTQAHFNSGDNIDYIYDEEGRKVGIKLNNSLKYDFSYSDDTSDVPQTVNDHINNTIKVIDAGKIELFDVNNNLIFSISSSIDDTTLTNNKNVFVNNGYSYKVVSNKDSDTFNSASNSGITEFIKSYVYNDFEKSRLESVSISNAFNTSFEYYSNDNISSLTNSLNNENQVYAYIYDNTGRITSETITISDNSETAVMSNNTHYTYENGYLTVAENNTTKWVYTYDESGNITEKKEYAVVDISGTKEYTLKQGGTDSYVYRADWKEELSSFNGQSFAYDDSGNPTTYRDHTLTWTFGRQLSSFGGITYTYDENGIRRSKTSNGKTTKYYTGSNNNVVYQSDGTTSITFYYDRTDNVTGFKYNGNNYFYVKNLQNDIVAITDSNGNVVVRYSYDPWGKIIGVDGNVSIGNLNPFRYRSYYYDTDTDLYYLQSRYYDPEVCRFINCDNINYIGTNFDAVSYNPFAYCKNDPVNYIDPTGTVSIFAIIAFFTTIMTLLTGCSKQDIYGAAPAYKNISASNGNRDKNPNCYAYAIGKYDKSYNPGDFSNNYTWKTTYSVNDVADAVISDMKKLGRGARIIKKYNTKINNNEYRIALRVKKTVTYILIPGYGVELDWDYHFMVQTKNGQWAEKHGPGGKTILYEKGNPNTISWDYDNRKNYYDSETIYLAITT